MANTFAGPRGPLRTDLKGTVAVSWPLCFPYRIANQLKREKAKTIRPNPLESMLYGNNRGLHRKNGSICDLCNFKRKFKKSDSLHYSSVVQIMEHVGERPG